MEVSTLNVRCKRRGQVPARHHAVSGGARERWDFVNVLPVRAAMAGGDNGRLAVCGAPVILSGGGGSAAVSIKQPMQQFSAQALPLSCPPTGLVWPASSVWQMTPRVLLTSAAARAAVKLASRLAS